MRTRRVLVIENESLLGAGIERLLKGEADLEVSGIVPENKDALLLEIDRIHPDVIILDTATAVVNSVELLSHLSSLPELRVVALNSDGSWMSILDKQQIDIESTADFVSLIRESGEQSPRARGNSAMALRHTSLSNRQTKVQ